MAKRTNKTNNTGEQSQLSERSNLEQNNDNKEKKETSKEEVDLALDISTSITGVCILSHHTGELLYLDNIKLNSTKFKSLWDKADFVEQNLIELFKKKSTYSFKRIFVEENAKRFTPGFSSADTILTLAKMNGICSYLARKVLKAEPIDVNVSSARKALGIKIDFKDKSLTTKEKTFIQVREILNNNSIWPQHLAKTGKSKGEIVYDVCCRDMSDAYVIGKGGQLIQERNSLI